MTWDSGSTRWKCDAAARSGGPITVSLSESIPRQPVELVDQPVDLSIRRLDLSLDYCLAMGRFRSGELLVESLLFLHQSYQPFELGIVSVFLRTERPDRKLFHILGEEPVPVFSRARSERVEASSGRSPCLLRIRC